MAGKQLVFSEDARRKLKNGMNVVANAVGSQFGVGFAGILESAQLSTIMQDALGKLITEELTPEEVNAQIQHAYSDVLAK